MRDNAKAERWIGGCRRELLDRTLIWNLSQLRRILREYEIVRFTDWRIRFIPLTCCYS